MYAVLSSRGEIFIASDIKRIIGNKLVFRVDDELCDTYGIMNITEAGEIYNPGTGQFVATWSYDEAGSLRIRFVENSGDLRQLTNSIFPYAPYLRFIRPKGAELVTIKWRRPGNKTLRDFKDVIKNYKAPSCHKASDISNKHRFIKLEGVIHNKVVCETMFDICTQRVVYIDLCSISADSVSDVFDYFGKSKFVGSHLDTLAMTDGKSTQFWNRYRYTECSDDESIYVVRTGRGFENVNIFNEEEYVNFYNSYIGRFYVSEFEVIMDDDFNYSVTLVNKQEVVKTRR